jgi:hypothetical protein
LNLSRLCSLYEGQFTTCGTPSHLPAMGRDLPTPRPRVSASSPPVVDRDVPKRPTVMLKRPVRYHQSRSMRPPLADPTLVTRGGPCSAWLKHLWPPTLCPRSPFLRDLSSPHAHTSHPGSLTTLTLQCSTATVTTPHLRHPTSAPVTLQSVSSGYEVMRPLPSRSLLSRPKPPQPIQVPPSSSGRMILSDHNLAARAPGQSSIR